MIIQAQASDPGVPGVSGSLARGAAARHPLGRRNSRQGNQFMADAVVLIPDVDPVMQAEQILAATREVH